MEIKKSIFILILSFLFISPIYAESCDKDDIERLKNLAEHVDVAYTTMDNFYDSEEKNRFNYVISLSNMTEELYGIHRDGSYNFIYDYQNIKNNVITEQYVLSGRKEIDIYSSNCQKRLRTIELLLPYYNINYNSEECKDINIETCKQWTKKLVSEKEYKDKLGEYKKNLNIKKESNSIIKKILEENSIYVYIIFLIILAAIVIRIIVNKKKNKLD